MSRIVLIETKQAVSDNSPFREVGWREGGGGGEGEGSLMSRHLGQAGQGLSSGQCPGKGDHEWPKVRWKGEKAHHRAARGFRASSTTQQLLL